MFSIDDFKEESNEYSKGKEIESTIHEDFVGEKYRNECRERNVIFSDGTHESRTDTTELINEYEQINIYRYKFTQNIMDELHNFAKIHQYDDRHSFKEAWNEWIETYDEIIKEEIERLRQLGYEGDILDKMFKSARYYFKKKSTLPVEAKERREYIPLQKTILSLMDAHIKNNIILKPSDGFVNFCNSHVEDLKIEIAYLIANHFSDPKLIELKFKKTYKNRYFNTFGKGITKC
jgi:hypothetical protein